MFKFAKAIERLRPCWLEEPFRVEDLSFHAKLRREVAYPIAGGESVTSLWEAEKFFAAGALDIFQPDVTVAGGFTQVRRLLALSANAGVKAALHCWGSGVSLMANLHMGFAAANCAWVEYCKYPNPLREGLLATPLKLEHGCTAPPQLPGLGVRLSEDFIRQYSADAGVSAGLVFEMT